MVPTLMLISLAIDHKLRCLPRWIERDLRRLDRAVGGTYQMLGERMSVARLPWSSMDVSIPERYTQYNVRYGSSFAHALDVRWDVVRFPSQQDDCSG